MRSREGTRRIFRGRVFLGERGGQFFFSQRVFGFQSVAITEYDLGDVSAHGEARRRSAAWGRAQDTMVEEAAGFLRARVPSSQQIASERERAGTAWIVKRGPAQANLSVGADFRKRFGERATFRVLGDSEEYRLGLASPSEAWRAGRGKALRFLYLSLLLAVLGAVLAFRPEVLLEALPRLE